MNTIQNIISKYISLLTVTFLIFVGSIAGARTIFASAAEAGVRPELSPALSQEQIAFCREKISLGRDYLRVITTLSPTSFYASKFGKKLFEGVVRDAVLLADDCNPLMLVKQIRHEAFRNISNHSSHEMLSHTLTVNVYLVYIMLRKLYGRPVPAKAYRIFNECRRAACSHAKDVLEANIETNQTILAIARYTPQSTYLYNKLLGTTVAEEPEERTPSRRANAGLLRGLLRRAAS